mgnify:CR=1 FL=1
MNFHRCKESLGRALFESFRSPLRTRAIGGGQRNSSVSLPPFLPLFQKPSSNSYLLLPRYGHTFLLMFGDLCVHVNPRDGFYPTVDQLPFEIALL